MDIELSRQFVAEVLARANELGLNVFVVLSLVLVVKKK